MTVRADAERSVKAGRSAGAVRMTPDAELARQRRCACLLKIDRDDGMVRVAGDEQASAGECQTGRRVEAGERVAGRNGVSECTHGAGAEVDSPDAAVVRVGDIEQLRG